MSALAKRYRAARAYAGLKQEELAEALGVDVQTIKRREGGTGDPKLAEQIAVAAVCGVPREFMTGGFETLTGEPTRDEIRDRLDALQELLIGQVATRPAPAPGGELGRRIQAHEPSVQHPEPLPTPEAEDDRRAGG